MKAVVTGGTGFIGSYLVEKLVKKNYQVICVSKDKMNADDLKGMDVELITGDINEGLDWKPLLEDADYIYHAAGVTRARKPSDYFEGNYEAAKKIVRQSALHCKKLKRFVFVSSQAAAGPSINGAPVTEDNECRPVSFYGKSKMQAEQEVIQLEGRFPYTIIRPSAVYGPRDIEMYSYIAMIKKRIQPLIGFNTKWLNFIYRDDLVDGIILAAESAQGENEIFFMAGEKNYRTEEIGDIIAKVIGRSRLKIYLPEFMVYLIGVTAELSAKVSGRDVFFNRQKVLDAVQPYWTCSIEKAQKLLGYKETFSLQEGMHQTCQWYRENGWL